VATIKSLKGKERREFIWDYYKVPIFAAAAVVIAVAYTLYITVINPPKKEYLSVAYYSSVYNEDQDALQATLNAAIPHDDATEEVQAAVFFTGGLDPTFAQAQAQAFVTRLSVGMIDVIMADANEAEGMAQENMLTPIDGFLPADLLDKYKDRLYKTADADGNETDFGFIIGTAGEYYPAVYVGSYNFIITIPANEKAARADRIVDFIRLCMGESLDDQTAE